MSFFKTYSNYVNYFILINTYKSSYNIIQSVKLCNNIEINFFPEYNNILKKFLYAHINQLTRDQVIFFNYISQIKSDNIENKYFLKGLNNMININNLDLLWTLSFEGSTIINIFIDEGKKILED